MAGVNVDLILHVVWQMPIEQVGQVKIDDGVIQVLAFFERPVVVFRHRLPQERT